MRRRVGSPTRMCLDGCWAPSLNQRSGQEIVTVVCRFGICRPSPAGTDAG